ncbi:MAG: GNAT family N-acetyltransferase, partial [Anaerolineales bacterium]
MADLSLSLLGRFHVTLHGEAVTGFESSKVRALLAYLAVEAHRPHRRDSLAALLWPDWPDRAARSNLRNALANLRKAIGDRHATPPFLHITRETMQFNTASDYWCDVTVFANLVAAQGSDPAAIEQLEAGLALYGGSLLEGFFLKGCPVFDDWSLLVRERLQRQALAALHRLAAYYEQRGQYEQACEYARRQLELEPWQEEAHQQVMRLLALSGRRGAALAHYETCRRLLNEELGVEPAAETTKLYQAIKEGRELPAQERLPAPAPPPAAVVKHNLPLQLTPFVGRKAVLAQIADRLQDPECRLLTLVGPSGSGKTRLALEAAAARLDDFQHGVYFVSLAPLESIEGIVPAVAMALGLPFYAQPAGRPQPQPRQQLLDYLHHKTMLLIMDNFEHLLEGLDLLLEVLKTAPQVKILVTSQATLNLQGEQVFPVPGMDLPEWEVPEDAGATLDDAAQYSAVELFRQSARRAQPGFALSDDNVADVIRICHLVQGMPLGILLAAAWVGVLTPVEIASEIGQSLDFLEAQLRDLPQRQRSMRAVFDHSWRLLSEREREVFQRLSVFRGGFTRQAARQVAGASLRQLRALVEKSLLQRDPQGRYGVHDLLRQYAAQRLAEVDGEAESLSASVPGTIRYLGQELPLSAVTSVSTSRRVRGQGLAKRLTAQLVAADATEGALVSALGMFEQGFYDQLGFGTGSYENWISFDPAQLKVESAARVPRRLTADDWELVHRARLERRRVHGSCNLLPPEITESELRRTPNGFGFGYDDRSASRLTHCFWCWTREPLHGPYQVSFLAYQTWEQLLELLAVFKSFGDQVWLVRLREPPGLQFQDLLEQPFRRRGVSERTSFETTVRAVAYWQMRVCDVAACLARTRLRGSDVRFNLQLSDPIERFLDQ